MIQIQSKLPNTRTTIFSVMSALAKQHGAINLSQGFPNFDSSPKLQELVFQYMQAGKNQYAPMPGLPALCDQLAQKAGQLYQSNLDPQSEITITAGATQAIYTAIAAVVQPGDEVILLEPAYDSYHPAVEVHGGIPVPLQLKAPLFRPPLDEIKEAINDKTRLLIINNPHNPTGTIWTAEDMHELESILDGTQVLLLSDEVYEHLIFDGNDHQSVLRFPNLYQRSFLTFSFGKTFHSTGWKIGYCIAPPLLTTEFRKVHQFNVFSVNTPMQHAIADYLEDPSVYLELPGFFQAKRDFFLNQMKGSSLKPLGCTGTYFQLFDYSAVSDKPDLEFAEWMTAEIGVASIPLSPFMSGNYNGKLIRLCFAKTEDTLEEAAKLLRGI